MTEFTVLKIGGKVIGDPVATERLCDRISRIKGPCVVVHGGGNLAGELCRRLDIPARVVGGRRITDRETLEVAVMTYAGSVNKKLVAALQRRGVNACGLSGCDLRLITARKRVCDDLDWGWVGDIRWVNLPALLFLLREGIVPVISPVTWGEEGELLNTNADSVATAVAKTLATVGVVDLVFCFDRPGLLRDSGDDTSVIPVLTREMYERERSSGVFHSGMLPKLESAFRALESGVRTVRLALPDDLCHPDRGTVIREL